MVSQGLGHRSPGRQRALGSEYRYLVGASGDLGSGATLTSLSGANLSSR